MTNTIVEQPLLEGTTPICAWCGATEAAHEDGACLIPDNPTFMRSSDPDLARENERLREELTGVLHEADWMLEKVGMNTLAYSAVKTRLESARAALAQASEPRQ